MSISPVGKFSWILASAIDELEELVGARYERAEARWKRKEKGLPTPQTGDRGPCNPWKCKKNIANG